MADGCRKQSGSCLEAPRWRERFNQGMIRTIRSSLGGRWGVKIRMVSISPRIAEHAGFLLSMFEVGQDGKAAYELLKVKSAKGQGMIFAARI